MINTRFIKKLFTSPLFGQSPRRARFSATLLIVSMAIVAITELLTPAGFAHGILYLAVVLFSMLAGSRRLVGLRG